MIINGTEQNEKYKEQREDLCIIYILGFSFSVGQYRRNLL
jgi:hypothetical protein